MHQVNLFAIPSSSNVINSILFAFGLIAIHEKKESAASIYSRSVFSEGIPAVNLAAQCENLSIIQSLLNPAHRSPEAFASIAKVRKIPSGVFVNLCE